MIGHVAQYKHLRLLQIFLTKGNSMALTTAKGSAGYLNRAFNDANASTSTFTTNVADLTASEIAAANKFDDATLTDAALAKKVLTNMGLLPTTNTSIAALEPALADYFATTGKGSRGFVVLQLSRIIADKVGDATYGTAATAWNTEVNDSIASSTGDLTTSATDVLTGSASDDIFTAITSALATANTLSATDKIDGGSGNDVLKLAMSIGNTAMTTGSVTGVETVELTNNSENSLAFNALGYTGVTTYTFNEANAPFTVTNLGTGVKTINLNSQSKVSGVATSTTFSTTFAAGSAELTNTTTDSVTLNLSSVGTSSSRLAAVSLGSFEVVNVALTGTNFAQLTSTDNKSIVVTGSGSNNFSTAPSSLTSFDASAATGNIVVNLTAAASGALTKVATGSGNDTVTYATEDGSAVATLSGGLGTDTLSLRSASGGTIEFTQTGFETLSLSTVGGALTISGAKTADLTTVTTSSVTAAAIDMVSMGAGNLTFNSTGSTGDHNVKSDHTGTVTLNYNASLGDNTGSDVPSANYTFSGATGVATVNVNAYTNTTDSPVTLSKASSVALNVASGLSTTELEITSFNNTITADVATSFVVDSKGQLGNAALAGGTASYAAKISGLKMTSGTITNGATAGKLILTTPLLNSLTTTSASALDLDETGVDLSGLETLAVTTTKGLTDFGALAKVSSITLTGTGTTSAVDIGNIGGSTAPNLTITASGLKGGTTIGTLQVAAGNDINVTADSLTGAFTIGSTISGVDDVTISAKNVAGAVNIGTTSVTATGDVSIDATGATGVASVGTVSGDKVTVKVSGSAATSTMSTITAKTSATLEYSAVDTNNPTVSAASGSTALAVSVKGGVLVDTVTITGRSTQTSITVTGDLGAGTDSLTIASGASTVTTGQTVDITGISSYNVGYITTGLGPDTIRGGTGADTIIGGTGQDTLTGGSGVTVVDTFIFSTGDSLFSAPDTITDLGTVDIITWGNGVTTVAADAAGSATGATLVSGIATFTLTTTAADKDSLAEVVDLTLASTATGRSAMFSYGAETYYVIDTGGTSSTAIVVKLAGVVIPSVTLANTGSTGITGFGA